MTLGKYKEMLRQLVDPNRNTCTGAFPSLRPVVCFFCPSWALPFLCHPRLRLCPRHYGEVQVADPPQTTCLNRRAVIISDDSDELYTPEARARVDREDAIKTLRDTCCDVEHSNQEISNIVRTFKTDIDSLLSKSLGMDPADVWGATSTCVESLTSPPAPSDARDDSAGSSKQPRVGPISSLLTSDSQTPVPLMSRPTPAAAHFEVPVIRKLVCRTCFVLLPFSAGPFTSEPSILYALSSSPSFHPPAHLRPTSAWDAFLHIYYTRYVPFRLLSLSILLYGQIPVALLVWHAQKQPN
jgi:hypothetical protein